MKNLFDSTFTFTAFALLLLVCSACISIPSQAASVEDYAEFNDEQMLDGEQNYSAADGYDLQGDIPEMTDEGGQPMELIPDDPIEGTQDTAATQH